MNLIPEDTYKTIIDHSINICVDIFVQWQNYTILVKRNQEPMKGVYWPIGGRVHKGETIREAVLRKIQEELCDLQYVDLDSITAIGFYEDQYDKNSFSENTHYHTLSIVHVATLNSINHIRIDSTSETWTITKAWPERLVIKPFEVF